jgi:arabinofuranosyltransferase
MSGSAVRWRTVFALLLAALGLVLAWHQRFVQDDAFISFTYARNLAEGHGLTWSGTRVEGYTNFLWVLWLALGARCGIELVLWSQITGLAAFAVVLHGTWRLARSLCEGGAAPLVTLALVVTNASVLAFATGGLETMLQAALLVRALLAFARLDAALGRPAAGARLVVRRAATLSLWLAAAVLARIDAALPAAVLLGWAVFAVWRTTRAATGPPGGAGRILAFLFGPYAVGVGGWCAWKLAYYGSVLPNTFHAKVAWGRAPWAAGAHYIGLFLHAYLLWPFLAAAAAAWALGRVRPPAGTGAAWGALATMVVTWCIYLGAAGGDFMEFRMLVPVAPLLFLALATTVVRSVPRYGWLAAVACVAVLAAASLQHARSFRDVTRDRRLDSVPALATFYGLYPHGDWSDIGRDLGRHLAGTDALVALHAVGAIPYYSRVRTLDMYGLNDAEIARGGNPAPPHYRRPGHQRQVSLAVLRRRGANFIIGHPLVIGRGLLGDPRFEPQHVEWARDNLGFEPGPLGQATLVAMPLSRGGALLMWYLTPTPELDVVVRREGWESRPVHLDR